MLLKSQTIARHIYGNLLLMMVVDFFYFYINILNICKAVFYIDSYIYISYNIRYHI